MTLDEGVNEEEVVGWVLQYTPITDLDPPNNRDQIEAIIMKHVKEDPTKEIGGIIATDGIDGIIEYSHVVGENDEWTMPSPYEFVRQEFRKGEKGFKDLFRKGEKGFTNFVMYRSQPNGEIEPIDKYQEIIDSLPHEAAQAVLGFKDTKAYNLHFVIATPNGEFNWAYGTIHVMLPYRTYKTLGGKYSGNFFSAR